MNKRVYLFELDSVITSPIECQAAQEKLFKELMQGNIVVLTFNQILSTTMFDLLDINQAKYTRDHILNLIKKKRICVSQFDNSQTPSAYISSKLAQSDVFKFSCMRFLNNVNQDPVVFSEIKGAFENKKAWRSWRDIKIDALTDEQKKVLFEYYSTMKELGQELLALEPVTEGLFDLEHYLRIVTAAVLSDRERDWGRNPALTRNAAQNVEKMLEIVHVDHKKITRSTCLDALYKIENADEASIKLCQAILDMSYNYQLERSISGITITHPMDNQSIVKTVADYYQKHDFTDQKDLTLPKVNKVLAWEIVDDFAGEYKKVKKENVDSRKCIKRFLVKAVAKTILSLALVVIFFLIGTYIESLMSWAGQLFKILVIGTWLVSEYLNWIVPTSIYDGFVSIIKLARYFAAYKKYKKGHPYFVKVNLTERIREKFKRDEKDE